MKANSSQEIFVNHIRDIFDAEKQAARIMPRMAKAVSDQEVRAAFEEHLKETRGQIGRLEKVFESLGTKARGKPCHGMKGLVEEVTESLNEEAGKELKAAELVAAGRKQEHYEIAAYEAVRSMAQTLGMRDVTGWLGESLDEEIRMERRLGQAFKRLIKEAGRADTAQAKGTSRATRAAGSGRTHSSRNSEGRTQRSSQTQSSSKRVSKATIDHEEIRRWAEDRGAHPACVRRTGGEGDIGMIRLDFPGYSGAQSLEEISWEDFFQKFDENRLALVYEEATASGQKSNFNKLVKRSSVTKTA